MVVKEISKKVFSMHYEGHKPGSSLFFHWLSIIFYSQFSNKATISYSVENWDDWINL